MAVKILTSIFGRYLGIDNSGYVVAPKKGFRESTVTTLKKGSTTVAYGVNIISSTADTAYTLPDPLLGVRVSLFKGTKSTDTITCSSNALLGKSTAAGPYNTITLKKAGQGLELMGLSSTLWGVVGQSNSTLSAVNAFSAAAT